MVKDVIIVGHLATISFLCIRGWCCLPANAAVMDPASMARLPGSGTALVAVSPDMVNCVGNVLSLNQTLLRQKISPRYAGSQHQSRCCQTSTQSTEPFPDRSTIQYVEFAATFKPDALNTAGDKDGESESGDVNVANWFPGSRPPSE